MILAGDNQRTTREVFLTPPTMSAKTSKSLTVILIVGRKALTLNQVN